jgi:hypothetical protein
MKVEIREIRARQAIIVERRGMIDQSFAQAVGRV